MNTKIRITFILVCALSFFAGAREKSSDNTVSNPVFDQYGGWKQVCAWKTGYFHTQRINGRWWFVTPDGNVFFGKGVGCIGTGGGVDWSNPLQVPNDPAPWPQAVSGFLKGLNFNAVAVVDTAMYRQRLAYAQILDLAGCQAETWRGQVLDYFSPEFKEGVERQAAKTIPPLANDPWLLGYFTDNELRWGHDWRGSSSMLDVYLCMPESSPGHKKAVDFLQQRGFKQGCAVPAVDQALFLKLVAEQYARVCTEAIHRYDKNHLILGCRFAGYLWGWCESGFEPDALLEGVAPYFDVISCNNYSPKAPVELFRKITEISGKPLVITEFSFRSVDSGFPNTRGAGMVVSTEQERADRYAAYVSDLATLPGCVGFYWFQYRDQSKDSPGENGNYGIVRNDHTPYETLANTMKNVNAKLEPIHRAGKTIK